MSNLELVAALFLSAFGGGLIGGVLITVLYVLGWRDEWRRVAAHHLAPLSQELANLRAEMKLLLANPFITHYPDTETVEQPVEKVWKKPSSRAAVMEEREGEQGEKSRKKEESEEWTSY